MTYNVILLSGEKEAYDLAKDIKPAFKCSLNGNFYTYDDVTTGTSAKIGDAENDEMFIIEWSGTGAPVLKGRKMFPR